MATVELVTAVMHQGTVLAAGARVTVEEHRADDWISRGLARTPVEAPEPTTADPAESSHDVTAPTPVEASDPPARRKKRGHDAES